MLKVKNVFLQHTLYIIHRGSISFWDDPWLKDYGPLRTYVSADHPHLVPTNEISIKDYLAPNGQWRLTSLQPILPLDIISAASASALDKANTKRVLPRPKLANFRKRSNHGSLHAR